MEEIKVGNYIRTKQWGIAKVNTVSNGKCIQIKNKNNRVTHYFEQIGSPSSNIIDLIEVGDYVNGHLVIAVDREKLEVSIENCMYGSDYEDINGNIDIKSIVTKEQFKAMEYEVEKCK